MRSTVATDEDSARPPGGSSAEVWQSAPWLTRLLLGACRRGRAAAGALGERAPKDEEGGWQLHHLIRVERSWDAREEPIEPKSRSGRRRVPLVRPLRAALAAHRLGQGKGGEGLVLGSGEKPFASGAAARRAREAWSQAGLEPIGLHECRHTYAAHMIAAGVNAKALSAYMGHASITITLDRYGHLMPGNEEEAAGMLEGYLAREAGG